MNAFKCLRLVSSRQTPHTRTALLRPNPTLSQRSPFSVLSAHRPTLPPTNQPSLLPTPGTTSAFPPSTHATLDLAGKISSHPGLGSMQIRCGPRDTYNPSHIVRKRRHGFLSRIRTKKGRKMIMRRLKKGRWNVSH